tara:strand:+ start:23747 stop:25114 length:1368 start_codon:yes stop_codon:yes gene_type:complete
MSSGGRIQLAAVGEQDIFLTANPETTYFVKRYKRHSQFAIQTLEVPFEQEAKFGGRVRAEIPRNGDLMREIYLKITLPEIDQSLITQDNPITGENEVVNTYPTYCDSVGHALVRQADIRIGGQTVETINGDYLDIYEDMFTPQSQSLAIQEMVGRTYIRTGLGPASNVVYRTNNGFDAVGAFPRTFLIPLRFWFTQDPNLAIPLSALKYQEVELNIDFENIERLVVSNDVSISDFLNSTAQLGGTPLKIESASLLVDYVFITDEEVSYFQNNSLDYVITQIQGVETIAPGDQNFTQLPKQIRTYFNNPVKEFYMIVQETVNRQPNPQSASTLTNNYFNYKSSTNLDNLNSFELLFNGEPRIPREVADGFYLRTVQPLQSHTKTPKRFIYNYSFSIDPENYAPTGQVNFSRIKDVLFNMYLNAANAQDRSVRIYVKNYNVLRIESGISGVLFNYNG